jgi:chromosome partitioning protein
LRKIALVNQKGGVGKTTTAVNLAAALARLGRRALLVDLDPQANATLALGIAPSEVTASVYDVLRGEAKAAEAVAARGEGFGLLPSRLDLAGIEMELAQTVGREMVLRDALKDVAGWDYVLIDCPPSLGLLNVNALTAAEEVFIPMQCEFFALQGIAMLMQTVGLVQRRLNPGLKVTGVIPCLFDARKGLAREVIAEIEKHFGERVFRTRVRATVRLAEAPSHGKTIFEYAPDSHGAADYLSLAREVAGLPAEAPPAEGREAKAVLPAEGSPEEAVRKAEATAAPSAETPPVMTGGGPAPEPAGASAGVPETAQPGGSEMSGGSTQQ